MGQAVIEGSLTPSMYLATGERRTVEFTDQVRRWIARGYVTLIGHLTAEVEAVVVAVEVDERTDSERHADEQAEGDGPDAQGVPAKNASRERWAKFLRANGVDFPDGDEAQGELWAGRDDLIIIWQQAAGGH